MAGLIGGLAMVPVGGLLRSLGYDVNEYGEAAIITLTGTASPPGEALLALTFHLVVSCLAAVPLAVVLLARTTDSHARLIGLAYGSAWWATINGLALPWLYQRPTPYEIGWADMCPSLLVHAVFGVVTAAVLVRRVPGPTVTGSSRPARLRPR